MKEDQGDSIVLMSSEQFLLCRDTWVVMNEWEYIARYFKHLDFASCFHCAHVREGSARELLKM